ncbi:MAG: hypothetical protein ACE5JE_09100 [Thermoplasmata archaeon]
MRTRRLLALAAVFLFAGLLTGLPVLGHGGSEPEIPHTELQTIQLAPGDLESFKVSFGDSPLSRGWLFVLNGRLTVADGPVIAELSLNGSTVARWVWAVRSEVQVETTILPETAFYEISFRNTGLDSTTLEIFYDQSCECVGKFLPMRGGVVIFQADLRAGETMNVEFLTTEDLEVHVDLAVRRGESGVWPDDFKILDSLDTLDGESMLIHSAETTERHYMITRAVSLVSGATGGVGPRIDISSPPSTPMLFLLAVPVLGGLGLAAYLLYRRREGREEHGSK